MANKGTTAGASSDTWHVYDPAPRVASISGTSTQLVQGVNSPPAGRYTYLSNGKVIMFQLQFAFGTSLTIGTGNAYLFKLPKRAKRSFPDTTIQPVVGVGFNYHAVTGNSYNQPVILQLARQYNDNSGNEDDYVELVTGGPALTFGTGSFTGRTATSTTITHNLGYTPLASDIDITWTGTDQAIQTTQGHWWISNITSTQFTVNIRNAVDL